MTAHAGLYGPETLLDGAGRPRRLTNVVVYQGDGVTPAVLYADRTKAVTLSSNAVQTDSDGNLAFYADPGMHVIRWTSAGVTRTLTVEVPVDYADVGSGPGGGGAVSSVFGRTGDVLLTKADVVGTGLAPDDIGADAAGAAATRQPLDADLTAIAALDTSTAGTLATDGAGWIKKTYAQLKAALGITTTDVSGFTAAAAAAAPVQSVAGRTGAVTLSSADLSDKGAANGVASLDGSGKVPQAQVPSVALTDFLGAVASQAAMLALTGQRGDWCTRTDLGTDWQLIADDPTQLANWRQHVYPASPVSSVAGRTGAVVLSTADVSGLGTAATHPATDFDAAGAAAAVLGQPLALAGATQPTRYVGRWAATGAPTSGTFAVGDFGFDGTNTLRICTAAGTPGTWASSGASAPSTGQNALTGMWHLSGYGVDKTGATDISSTLASLVTAVNAAGGGTIWADDGSYKWASTVPWKSGVSLKGAHKSTVKFLGYTVDTPLIRYTEASDSASAVAPLTDCTFSNFTIDGANQTCTGGVYNVSTKGIFIQHMRRVSFKHLYVANTAATGLGCDFGYEAVDFTDNEVVACGRLNSGAQPGGSGIGFGSAATTDDEPVTITGNYCTGNKRYGIFVESQNSPAFSTMSSGGRITNNVCRSNAIGIADSGNWRLMIVNNDVFNNTVAGISVDTGTYTSGRTGYHGIIALNQVYKNTGPGIRFDYSGTSTNTFPGQYMVRSNEVSNNTGEGILVGMDTVSVNAVHIVGNNCYKNTLSGIRIDYTGATKTAVLGQCEIRENICDNNGTSATSGNRDGIRIQVPMTSVDIRNNRCWDFQGSKTQGWGLAVGTAAATITGGSISDNDFRNNLTGATIFTNSPTGVHVANNLGSTPPAPQTVTPAASPWTYTAPDFPTVLNMTGGTVSAITVGGVTVASTSERQLLLEPGDSVVTTYTAAPTVTTRAR